MSNTVYERKDGLLIVKPDNYSSDPLDCSVCGLALRHREDIIEHRNFGCCLECSLEFRQPNKKKWDEGWRPNRKEVIDRIIRIN